MSPYASPSCCLQKNTLRTEQDEFFRDNPRKNLVVSETNRRDFFERSEKKFALRVLGDR